MRKLRHSFLFPTCPVCNRPGRVVCVGKGKVVRYFASCDWSRKHVLEIGPYATPEKAAEEWRKMKPKS